MKHYKKLKIEYGTAPYLYSWSSNSSCLKFDTSYPVSGSTNSIVEALINISNEVCYGNSTATLNVVDANNCKKTYNINLVNPCLTFENPIVNFNGITKNNYYFNATPVGGAAPYTYNWEYPTNIFTSTGNITSQTLQLSLIPNAPIIFNTPYPVSVTITDANGCVRRSTYNYSFCRPLALGQAVLADCNTNDFSGCGNAYTTARATVNLVDLVEGCSNTSIRWNTLNIYPDSSVQGVNIISNVNGLITICLDLILISNTYDLDFNNNTINLKYTVLDSNNIESTIGDIYLVVPTCVLEQRSCMTTLPSVNVIDCNPTLPYTITQELEGSSPLIIKGSANIDWNTFTFIPSTGQTLTNSKLLTLSYGTIALNTNHEIVITLNSIPSTKNAEVIKWKVCDESNCCSQTTSDILILQCLTPPVATNDSYCVACGENETLNITLNDTGNISGGSMLIITQNPTQGQANISGLNINYVANPNYFGQDIIKYKVKDDNGLDSNEATITIDVSCAGNPENTVIC